MADLDRETARTVSQPQRIDQRAVGKSGLGVAWSPDGRFIAYTRESGGSMALRPDGRRIAFVSGEGGTDEVWVIRNLLSVLQPARK